MIRKNDTICSKCFYYLSIQCLGPKKTKSLDLIVRVVIVDFSSFSNQGQQMKFLSTFKIKVLERWLQLVDDLQPYMDEYGYKMFFASTYDDETVIFDLNATDDQEKALKMLNLSEVINMRKNTGIYLESQETLSVISKHKVW